ncbi:MAG: hypothetical protein KHZ90_08420 [Veillonella parvula]|uniref:Uncharacterized protein n=1 Tax=Veillonella parvula TaxID=29466 RepID=A0A943A3R2_VEIPA|nr:hypothetical protein [Veillonella parvula]EGT3606773.1 hypothetical protein [Clostridium perfringens]MBS4893785.1 hypothetical protein [Veillonella parvula]
MSEDFNLIRECYMNVENKEISRRKLLHYYNCLPINLKINMNKNDIETFCKIMKQIRYERNYRLTQLFLKLFCISWIVAIFIIIFCLIVFK